jgi:peptidoglycan/LPS O-acetylase OafA/YrhL
MQLENKPRFYHPELDGLRFIAFLLVFIHNANPILQGTFLEKFSEYSWFGVDLFFCLSGFLITKLLVTEREQTGEINIRNFYMRRILRIWPLYFVYIIIGLFFILLTDGWNSVIPNHFVGLATFTYNVVYLLLTYKVFVVYFHLWTISYEEQFYAVIPWVIRKISLRRLKVIWLYLCGFFIMGSLIRAIFIYFNVKHPAVYMLPITHFEAILGGIAIGLGLFDGLLVNVKGWILLLAGLGLNALIFALPNTYEIGWNLILTYPLVGAGMTLTVLGVTKSDNSIINKLLKSELQVYLGKISYGLYIFHLLGLSLVIRVTQGILGNNISGETNQAVYFFASLLITILLSIASYHFLEKPFLKLKEPFSSITSRPI